MQTVLASFFSFPRELSDLRRFVYLPDGEKMVVEITLPKGWKERDPTVVMVHGLAGSHRSNYLLRMVRKLQRLGIKVARLNLRGCGSGRGHGKKMYHVDGSEDVWHTLKELKRDAPHSPLILVGFSLGGNIILKMAGERGEEAKELIQKIIAISPPIDLASSAQRLSQTPFYERFFMNALREDVAYRHETFPDLPPIRIPYGMSLMEFDELYIAPQSGYHSAADYYRACSSGRVLHHIVCDTHILFAKDDPIVNSAALNGHPLPPHIDILVTERGGHVGYLGMPWQEGGVYWLDSLILDWIKKR